MKRSIEWHEQCYSNFLASLAREIAHLERQQEKVDRMWSEAELKAKQIDRAKKEGKEAFDDERYGVKR